MFKLFWVIFLIFVIKYLIQQSHHVLAIRTQKSNEIGKRIQKYNRQSNWGLAHEEGGFQIELIKVKRQAQSD